MEKWLCWGSLGAAGIFLLLLLLDLIISIPFSRISAVADILGIIACALVGYLAWTSYKELR